MLYGMEPHKGDFVFPNWHEVYIAVGTDGHPLARHGRHIMQWRLGPSVTAHLISVRISLRDGYVPTVHATYSNVVRGREDPFFSGLLNRVRSALG
jgi:hypothetical protein